MSINVNDKNLGHATAYAYYKAGGGTMTEAEFTEFMADFGTASQTAVEAAQAALASKNAAQTAATTATTKASEATTAATTATTKAGEASMSASTATSAKDTAVSASQTATTKATEATTAAATATSAKTDAVAANTAAQSAKTAAQTAQTGAETAAASVEASAEQIATNTDDIAQLMSDFNNIYGILFNNINIEQGGLDTSGINDDPTSSTHNKRVRSVGFISVKEAEEYIVTINTSKTVLYSVSFYESASYSESRLSYTDWKTTTQSFTAPTGAKYCRLLVKTNPEASLAPSDINFVTIQNVTNTFEQNITALNTLTANLLTTVGEATMMNPSNFEQGGFYTDGTNDVTTSASHYQRIRTTGFFAVESGKSHTISLMGSKPMQWSVSFYSAPVYTDARISYIAFSDSGQSFVVPAGARYGRVLVKYLDGTNITPSDLSGIYFSFAESLSQRVLNLERGSAVLSNYAITDTMLKNPLSISYLGQLSYLQSFCKYNGKYYSTNGTNISVQEADFSESDNVSLNVGHGNSMQVGTAHPNYAYISGWNDQNVYVVNLETLTLVDTVTLPTSGYTTVAVDDVNGLMYIFQRDTYPSDSEVFYNFIVYDYVNDSIVSTKKTGRAFAAMQSVDYVEGKIYVLNGLGTSQAPNYYLVYNTAGDIIGEYVLNYFETNEPEGIFIDRESKEIYFSFEDKSLYRIS